jgi:hypothetical protein
VIKEDEAKRPAMLIMDGSWRATSINTSRTNTILIARTTLTYLSCTGGARVIFSKFFFFEIEKFISSPKKNGSAVFLAKKKPVN